jgi:hypothetical protein
MLNRDLVELFVQPLNQLGVQYLVSGSVAVMMYGEPRLTNDIDLVVFLRREDIPRLREVFPPPSFYVPPIEVILVEMARERRGHFNVIHSDSGLKADFYTANRDELHAWASQRSKRIMYQGIAVSLAPIEYVIVRKLEYFREGGSDKHLRDIRSMLAVSGELVDQAALEDWIARRALQEEWKQVQ